MFKFKYFFLILLAAGLLFSVREAAAKVPTPQIYQVVTSTDNSLRPWVIGWTPNNVAVEVLVDDKPQGMAKVVKSESGTASFGWSPQQDLTVGWHEFRVRGKFNNDYSQPGAILGYQVRYPTPVPVLLEPEQQSDYILFKGLIRNNLSVKIYIDGLLKADFKVPNHPSGTSNFWYKSRDLLNGVHEAYAVAYDETGKVSQRSRLVSFKTEMQKITKSEEYNTVNEESLKNTNAGKVIDKELPGSVKIVEPENTEEAINTDDQSQGEISTAAEEESTVSNSDTDENGFTNQAKKNRIIGLIILFVIAIILFIWYEVEKKKFEKESELDDNKNSKKNNK